MNLETVNTQDDREWTSRAECSGSDGCDFFPIRGANYEVSVARAKLICKKCEVQKACLDYAMGNREPFGIWGGLTLIEREKLLRIQRKLPE